MGRLLAWSSGAAACCPARGKSGQLCLHTPPHFILWLIPSVAGDLRCKGETRKRPRSVLPPQPRAKLYEYEYQRFIFLAPELTRCHGSLVSPACTKQWLDRVRAAGKLPFAPIAWDNALALASRAPASSLAVPRLTARRKAVCYSFLWHGGTR